MLGQGQCHSHCLEDLVGLSMQVLPGRLYTSKRLCRHLQSELHSAICPSTQHPPVTHAVLGSLSASLAAGPAYGPMGDTEPCYWVPPLLSGAAVWPTIYMRCHLPYADGVCQGPLPCDIISEDDDENWAGSTLPASLSA